MLAFSCVAAAVRVCGCKEIIYIRFGLVSHSVAVRTDMPFRSK